MHAALLQSGTKFLTSDALTVEIIVDHHTACRSTLNKALVIVLVLGIATAVVADDQNVVLGGSHLLTVFHEIGYGVGLEQLC